VTPLSECEAGADVLTAVATVVSHELRSPTGFNEQTAPLDEGLAARREVTYRIIVHITLLPLRQHENAMWQRPLKPYYLNFQNFNQQPHLGSFQHGKLTMTLAL
jgi:hypothetical protein